MIGTGVALAGAGGGFLYLASKRQHDVDTAPIHDADDFEHLVDLEDEGERYTKIGGGLLIAGGAVAAIGVIVAIVRGASGGDDDESEPKVSVGAAPIPGGVGFSLTVRGP